MPSCFGTTHFHTIQTNQYKEGFQQDTFKQLFYRLFVSNPCQLIQLLVIGKKLLHIPPPALVLLTLKTIKTSQYWMSLEVGSLYRCVYSPTYLIYCLLLCDNSLSHYPNQQISESHPKSFPPFLPVPLSRISIQLVHECPLQKNIFEAIKETSLIYLHPFNALSYKHCRNACDLNFQEQFTMYYLCTNSFLTVFVILSVFLVSSFSLLCKFFFFPLKLMSRGEMNERKILNHL